MYDAFRSQILIITSVRKIDRTKIDLMKIYRTRKLIAQKIIARHTEKYVVLMTWENLVIYLRSIWYGMTATTAAIKCES